MKKILLITTLSTLFFLNLYAKENKVNLQNIVIEKNENTDKYKKKENLLEEPKFEEKSKKAKEDSITVDGGVDFNKAEKSVEGVKINLGTKF